MNTASELGRMAANRVDTAIRRHFADTPLYLATIIDTHFAPRAVWTETEDELTIGEGKIRILTFVCEAPLNPVCSELA